MEVEGWAIHVRDREVELRPATRGVPVLEALEGHDAVERGIGKDEVGGVADTEAAVRLHSVCPVLDRARHIELHREHGGDRRRERIQRCRRTAGCSTGPCRSAIPRGSAPRCSWCQSSLGAGTGRRGTARSGDGLPLDDAVDVEPDQGASAEERLIRDVVVVVEVPVAADSEIAVRVDILLHLGIAQSAMTLLSIAAYTVVTSAWLFPGAQERQPRDCEDPERLAQQIPYYGTVERRAADQRNVVERQREQRERAAASHDRATSSTRESRNHANPMGLRERVPLRRERSWRSARSARCDRVSQSEAVGRFASRGRSQCERSVLRFAATEVRASRSRVAVGVGRRLGHHAERRCFDTEPRVCRRL